MYDAIAGEELGSKVCWSLAHTIGITPRDLGGCSALVLFIESYMIAVSEAALPQGRPPRTEGLDDSRICGP